jgi:hypothetical protein
VGLEAVLGGSGDPAYPGGPWFNLFNLGGKSEAEMKKLKLNEIKNGRLAMLAVFGYGAQVRAGGVGVGWRCVVTVVSVWSCSRAGCAVDSWHALDAPGRAADPLHAPSVSRSCPPTRSRLC